MTEILKFGKLLMKDTFLGGFICTMQIFDTERGCNIFLLITKLTPKCFLHFFYFQIANDVQF